MKNWFTVEPDVIRIMNKHYSPGRGGQKIEYITRHHLAGIGTTEDVWGWWQTRQASAHYVVENSGRIGQLVWDRDTAWSNANALSNQRSIAIEHSNSTGKINGSDNFPSWQINDTVIREGARLAAALCWFYKLGRPVFGKNIRDHRQFYGTSCPHHLAAGGRYHDTWMRIAQEHYDWMVANPGGQPPKQEAKDVLDMDEARLREIIREETFRVSRDYVGPGLSDTKDIRQQLTGGRDLIPGDLAASFPGWDLATLIQNVRDKGHNGLTVVDMMAVLLAGDDNDIAAVRRAAGTEK